MAKRKIKPSLLSPNTEIEVILRKRMTLEDYERQRSNLGMGGWNVAAYQLEYFSEPINKIEE